jgi:hypothetical protein
MANVGRRPEFKAVDDRRFSSAIFRQEAEALLRKPQFDRHRRTSKAFD